MNTPSAVDQTIAVLDQFLRDTKMNMKANTNSHKAMSGAMAETQGRVSRGGPKGAVLDLDINVLKSKLEAYVPPKRYTAIEIVRELFPLLEAKRKEGASSEQLADVLREMDWEVSAQTLKTQMSSVRRESKIEYVTCPRCGTNVPDSSVAAHRNGEEGGGSPAAGA